MKQKILTGLEINDWQQKTILRPVQLMDLRSLEWEGTYIHLRQVYKKAYQRSLEGKTLMWAADLPGVGIIGQIFFQLVSSRIDLADGKHRSYLYAFRIRPTYRYQGLGKMIMAYTENDLLNRGFREITLNVAKKNLPAIELYQKSGYKIVGHETGEWSFRDHQNKMRKIIEPAWRMLKRIV